MSEPIRLKIVFRPGMDPFDRQWFEEQLEEIFAEDGLGEVIGGGTALDGSCSDIALDINERERGLAVVRSVLRREQAPRGTQIVEQGEDCVIHEVYDDECPYVEPEKPTESDALVEPEPRSPDLPQVGDTYLVPLGPRLFGACRVIGISNNKYSTLVAGTNWFGEAPPVLAEPLIRSLLIHKCVGAVGPSCTYWLVGKPPQEFRYLGAIAPSAEEQRIGYGQYTHYWYFIANSLRMEWEWLKRQQK